MKQPQMDSLLLFCLSSEIVGLMWWAFMRYEWTLLNYAVFMLVTLYSLSRNIRRRMDKD